MTTDSFKFYVDLNSESDDPTKPADCCRSCMYMSCVNRKVFEALCKISNSLDNRSIILQLDTFCNCLTQLLQKESYYNTLPMMSPQFEEDELYLEWIFKDFRFGFLFCDNPSESGWTMTMNSDGSVKSICAKFNDDIPKSVETITSYLLRLT